MSPVWSSVKPVTFILRRRKHLPDLREQDFQEFSNEENKSEITD
jgi:hypothetical protein